MTATTQPFQLREDIIAVPLCVDLDGTLIRTDLLWVSMAVMLRRNVLRFFLLPVWWMRGRAYLKRQIAAQIEKIDPSNLPYNGPFLEFLRSEHRRGRILILATASDGSLARQVADYLGLFSQVLASNGNTNVRGVVKARMLVEKFGERGFDYAGNSFVDLAVWRKARAAIVVGGSTRLIRRVASVTKVAKTF